MSRHARWQARALAAEAERDTLAAEARVALPAMPDVTLVEFAESVVDICIRAACPGCRDGLEYEAGSVLVGGDDTASRRLHEGRHLRGGIPVDQCGSTRLRALSPVDLARCWLAAKGGPT